MRKRIPALNFLSALLLTLLLFNSALAQGGKKIAYGVLVDNTGSLRSQFPQVLMIGKAIVEQIHQRGAISLFNFRPQGDQISRIAVVTLGVQWSEDKRLLNNYIDSLMVVPGQTTLLDAINSIAEQLNAKASLEKDVFGDKVMFLITDGEDRESETKQKQLLKTLKESGIKVYAVGMVKELDKEGGFIIKAPRQRAIDLLEKMAKETGGRAVFIKSKKDAAGKLLNELFAK